MKTCKINKVEIKLNYENILADFSVIQFSTTDTYIKYGALFLDEVNLELKAKSIVFEKGKSFYALFDKEKFEKIDLAQKLKALKSSDTLVFNHFDTSKKLELVPQYLLSQLLVNSVSAPKHERLSFNNLTGKLYLFDPNHLKISKTRDKEQIFKVVGLEVKINMSLSLELNVRTFSNVLLSKKMNFKKKKFNDYPKYTFVNATNTLKRVLNSKNNEGNQFILKQTTKNGQPEKNTIPFLDFKDLANFNSSKIGLLNSMINNVNNKLSNYIDLTFIQVKIKNVIRFQNPTKVDEFSFKINLIDGIDDEDSRERINDLKTEITLITPLSEISLSKRESQKYFNIKLIQNKSYYSKYNLDDPYKSSTNIQHITIQDFKVNSKASIKAILKELMIKKDIRNKELSIVNWNDYNYRGNWIFGNKIEDEFYFLTISKNGKLKFENLERNLFNQNEYDELCGIFDNDSNIEFIIKDDFGNINSIKRTQAFSLPEFEIIHEVLLKENENLKLEKDEVIALVKEYFEDSKQLEFISQIRGLEKWDKQSLLSCFPNRADKKELTKIVQNATGEILKSYLRDKTRYEILDSQLDIHYFQEENKEFYFVGIKGAGIQQQISRASVIREIEAVNNSEFIFEKLLLLMNVDFVKNGDLTVIPFPLKYLREWVRANHNLI